ncbi:alpha-amylase family glycosyl hydrolase [Mucilaginibacter sp.]
MKIYKNSLFLFILLNITLAGCGKKPGGGSNPTPTPSPAPGSGSGSAYTDPSQYGTPFSSVPATKDIVMYEVNIRTFTPANFQGVQARLDSIKALGVNVIWLMPTYPVGTVKSVNSPYCVKDYTGVNADFGTLDDLRSLVTQAHNKGMAVILDWVANHTAWDNAWTSNKAWYLQDASGNIISPPNTTFSDVAALNFNNADMRTAMIRAMKYWVFNANIDGYRCDFADNVPADFWKQALDTLSNIKTHKLIYLAEGTTAAEINSGFQLSYSFSYYNSLKGVFGGTAAPSALVTTNTSEVNSIPATGTKLRYSINHDLASSDGSTISLYNGKQGALAAFALTTYMNGVPLIYSSQEVGYPNKINFFANVAVDYTANPDMVAAYKQIIAFRKVHEAIKTGTLTVYNNADVIAFERTAGTDDVLVLVNARNTAVNYPVPAQLQGGNWANGYTNATVTLPAQLSLPAYGYAVFKKL